MQILKAVKYPEIYFVGVKGELRKQIGDGLDPEKPPFINRKVKFQILSWKVPYYDYLKIFFKKRLETGPGPNGHLRDAGC